MPHDRSSVYRATTLSLDQVEGVLPLPVATWHLNAFDSFWGVLFWMTTIKQLLVDEVHGSRAH